MKKWIKIVQALGDSNIILRGVTKTTKNETKEQKVLGVLGASLIGNLLSGKWILEIKKEKEL